MWEYDHNDNGDDNGRGGDFDEQSSDFLNLPPEIVSGVIGLVARGDVDSLARLCASSRMLRGFCATPSIRRDVVDPNVAVHLPGVAAAGGGTLVSPIDLIIASRQATTMAAAQTRRALYEALTRGRALSFPSAMSLDASSAYGPFSDPAAIVPPLDAFVDTARAAEHFIRLLPVLSHTAVGIHPDGTIFPARERERTGGTLVVPDAEQRRLINEAVLGAGGGGVAPPGADLFAVFPTAARHVWVTPDRPPFEPRRLVFGAGDTIADMIRGALY